LQEVPPVQFNVFLVDLEALDRDSSLYDKDSCLPIVLT
jgi:hypothetical protein